MNMGGLKKLKIFVSGSRSVSQLTQDFCHYLTAFTLSNETILVGDASGVDKLVQAFLNDLGYRNVIVYHAYSYPRNNLGNWETVGNFSSYIEKDKAMGDMCNTGLVSSKGTKRNHTQLKKMKKPFVMTLA